MSEEIKDNIPKTETDESDVKVEAKSGPEKKASKPKKSKANAEVEKLK